jgi:hypothetical protein
MKNESTGKQLEDVQGHERIGFRVDDSTEIRNVDLESGADPEHEFQEEE